MALDSVTSYCDRRVPERVRDQMLPEATVRGSAITINERRPSWREGIGSEWTSQKIAQMRYDATTRRWTIYWADRNGRWLRYPPARPARSVKELLEIIENDSSGAFFG